MRLPAASLSLVLCACSGAPIAITVDLTADASPDASVGAPHDASPPEDVAAPLDAYEAAPAPDSAIADVSVPDVEQPDTAQSCSGSAPPATPTYSESCFASVKDGVCPPCAPFGYYCNQNEIPSVLPLTGLLGIVVNGGRRWCSPEPYCVRLATHDADCGGVRPTAYSCSSSLDGAVLGQEPGNCNEIAGTGGMRIACCG